MCSMQKLNVAMAMHTDDGEDVNDSSSNMAAGRPA